MFPISLRKENRLLCTQPQVVVDLVCQCFSSCLSIVRIPFYISGNTIAAFIHPTRIRSLLLPDFLSHVVNRMRTFRTTALSNFRITTGTWTTSLDLNQITTIFKSTTGFWSDMNPELSAPDLPPVPIFSFRHLSVFTSRKATESFYLWTFGIICFLLCILLLHR